MSWELNDHIPRQPSRSQQFVVCSALFLLDVVLLCAATAKHTFWRDETLAWLIARDSPTVSALFHNLRYEPHPPLWHLLLYPITRLSGNPDWMKLPNLVFAVVAAALVLFSQRLNLLTRIGISFSYFFLFEYGVIDRNYMLGIILLLPAIILSTGGNSSKSWLVPILLSLAALSSLPALILAVGVLGVYLAQAAGWFQPRNQAQPRPRLGADLLLGSLLVGACVLASILMIRPPADSGLYLVPKPSSHGPLGALLDCGRYLTKAYLPIPVMARQFWERTYFDMVWPHHIGSIVNAIIGFPLLIGLTSYFRQPIARYFFLGGSAVLLLQIAISGRPFMHHLGWLFVCLALALFVEQADREGPVPAAAARPRWTQWVLSIVLVSQVYAGLFAIAVSLRFPFSGSRQVAELLRSRNLDSAPLVFEPDYVASSVLAYLQRPLAYDLELHRETGFPVWDREEFLNQHVPTRAELDQATGGAGAPVLIIDKPLTPEQQSQLQVHLLAAYDGAIASDSALDSYYIYR